MESSIDSRSVRGANLSIMRHLSTAPSVLNETLCSGAVHERKSARSYTMLSVIHEEHSDIYLDRPGNAAL